MQLSKIFAYLRGVMFIGIAIYILFFADESFNFQVWQRYLFAAILIGLGAYRLVHTYRS